MKPSDSTEIANPSLRYSILASHALAICVIVSLAYYAVYPLFNKAPWIAYEEDDFFYYLKIAGNLAHGFGSTFNGIVSTNGYHPLWLVLLTTVLRVSSSTVTVPIFLACATFCASLVTYILCRRLLVDYVDNPLLTRAMAGFVAVYSMHVFNCGMEIILTIPLLLAVAVVYQNQSLWLPKFIPSLGFGLLLSALILSRLDTLLVVILLGLATLLHPTLRAGVHARQLAGVLLGLTPVFFYFLSNRALFGTWLPISGMAKQLKTNHLPSLPAWHSLVIAGQLPHAICVLIAILILPAVFTKLTVRQQALYPVLLVFPFLYIFILSCLSDWQLWNWYFYSLRAAVCVSFAIFILWRPTNRLLTNIWVSIAIGLVVLTQVLRSRREPEGFVMYPVAMDVSNFAATHPGVYAMGDRAGMLGFLLPDPLVQTEGLVMDREFLSLIRKRTPLKEVLAEYKVRYYIAMRYGDTPVAPCFYAVEPLQAGPASPHIEGNFCQPPSTIFRHIWGDALIFDLGPRETSTRH